MRSIKLIETIRTQIENGKLSCCERVEIHSIHSNTHSYRKMICQRFRWTFSISISIDDHLHHFFKWCSDFGLFLFFVVLGGIVGWQEKKKMYFWLNDNKERSKPKKKNITHSEEQIKIPPIFEWSRPSTYDK